MQKWEYLIYQPRHSEMYWMNGKQVKMNRLATEEEYEEMRYDLFNKLGEQGWELISSYHGFIFKRPKQ